jgi:hypothetical protein
MSPLVDHLPKVSGVPTPKDVLGYYVGEPKRLTRVAEISKYYRALASASKRVKVLSAGTTDEGRECLVAVISDEENIRNLDTLKANLARLADPRSLAPADAKRIIEQSKPVYFLTGGLHSGETGPPEMLMELAYRLAVEESPLYDSIRKNVVVMVNNSSDPDGRDRFVDWYYRYGTVQETEQDRVPGPPYWGKYIFHDNNRDINYSQVTMRNWLDFYLQWHPPIMHDLHESQPLLYTFSGQAPQNPTLDPILYAELPWFANFEMTKLISYGIPVCGRTPLSICGRRSPSWRPTTTACCGCTRPSAMEERTPSVAPSADPRRALRPTPAGAVAAAVAEWLRANGTGRCRPLVTSSGRCATTRITWKQASSLRSS